MMKHSAPYLAICLFLMLISLACTSPLESLGNATPEPQRFAERESIYVTQSGDELFTVTLDEIYLLNAGDDPDTQLLAVLADGNGDPSYMLYPSNQPGIPDDRINLPVNALKIRTEVDEVGLWIVVLRNQAYPVVEAIGIEHVAEQLANGFDVLQGQPLSLTTASIVASSDPQLLKWFGTIDVLGELILKLETNQEVSSLTEQIETTDGGFQLTYTLETNVTSSIIPAPPTTTESNASSSLSSEDIEGYRKVIDEDFENLETAWFLDKDETYTVEIADGIYQIKLLNFGPLGDSSISWGSLQDQWFDNYVVRARIGVLESDVLIRYGLWLHYRDEFNFLSFGLENTGRYRIARFQNEYTELSEWTSNDAIHQGAAANDLEVQLNGNLYTLTVNGELITRVSDPIFEAGRIAFFCYAEGIPATCQLDHLEVWIPEDTPFPISPPS